MINFKSKSYEIGKKIGRKLFDSYKKLPLAIGLENKNWTDDVCRGLVVGDENDQHYLNGVQLGLENIINVALSGVQTGLINTGRSVNGVQLGLSNDGHSMKGVQVGAVNNETNKVYGMQIGILNACSDSWSGKVSGVQVGFGNETNDLRGYQTGVLNVCRKDGKGVQTGLFNLSDESISGIQIGGFNDAGLIRGLQIGVVNRAEYLRGVQLGVICSTGCYGDSHSPARYLQLGLLTLRNDPELPWFKRISPLVGWKKACKKSVGNK